MHNKFKLLKFWECPLNEISEYAFNMLKLVPEPKLSIRQTLCTCTAQHWGFYHIKFVGTGGKLRVQIANGLVSRLPHLCASTHTWHVIPKVSTQVYMLDRKIWKLFRPRGNGQKNTKCDQFFCPTSDFWNPCFFYHIFTNDAKFVDKAAETCDHCYIAVQLYWKINIRTTGDQCRHNKLATLVPSVLV